MVRQVEARHRLPRPSDNADGVPRPGLQTRPWAASEAAAYVPVPVAQLCGLYVFVKLFRLFVTVKLPSLRAETLIQCAAQSFPSPRLATNCSGALRSGPSLISW